MERGIVVTKVQNMSKGTITRLFGLTVGCAAMTQIANAAIMVDIDGPGVNSPTAIESFDFLPGNSLNVGALTPAVLPPPIGSSAPFKNLFQARLGAVLDQGGNVVMLTGLNDTNVLNPSRFEITVVAEFDLAVTGNTTNPILTTTTTQILPNSGVNYVRVYFDKNVNANDLAGTGFTDGTLILEGKATFGGSSLVEFNTLPAVAFDQFNTNDYPTVQTKTGVGGLTLDANVINTHAAFFLSSLGVASINASTTNVFPFKQINPSHQFTSDPGVPVAVVPNIGTINGNPQFGGRDIQFQTDATVSFTAVPEPGTLMVLGLGTLGLMLRRRHA